MTTLYLIRGVPGSGKSTMANTLFHAGIVKHVFEADHFMVDHNGEYRFDPRHLHSAHLQCQFMTDQALDAGESVAVSNTSTTEQEVETYRKIAEKNGAEFVSIIVENRHGGTNIHDVPIEKINQMKSRFSVKL